VRVAILTGSGRAFCAGGDVGEFLDIAAMDAAGIEGWVRFFDILVLRIRNLEKPTIAAVNGPAVGGGCCLAMLCDMRIAAEEAKLGLVFTRRGLAGADMGATWFLPRLVGMGKAFELLLTGDLIDAREAERIGLVNRVVPAPELMPTARELAAKLAAGPPIGMKLTKRALNRSLSTDLTSHLDYEAAVQTFCFQTKDLQEGVKAFLEKRSPRFKGE